MIMPHETLHPDFLLDDLNDLVQLHHDLLASYKNAYAKVKSSKARRLFIELSEYHHVSIKRLCALIRVYDGEVRSEADLSSFETAMRVLVRQVVKESGVVRAMLAAENKLFLEYVRDLRSLSYLPGLEPELRQNLIEAERRTDQLEALLDTF